MERKVGTGNWCNYWLQLIIRKLLISIYCIQNLELYFFQVSLGITNDLLSADYTADKLPAGKHSVRGMGSIGPDPSMAKTL